MRLFPTSLAVLFFCVPLALWAEDSLREIVVSGEGRVSVQPDLAVLTLGVTREARLAKDALDDTSREVSTVLDTLKRAGVAPPATCLPLALAVVLVAAVRVRRPFEPFLRLLPREYQPRGDDSPAALAPRRLWLRDRLLRRLLLILPTVRTTRHP